MTTRGSIRRKPHTQVGQKGKGTGRRNPRRPYPTAGLPFQTGQMPNMPPNIPNFLPSTPGFERGMSTINDQRSLLENRFGNQIGMIQPTLNMSLARLDTDQEVATDRLDENMAERGVFTSGFRPTLYQQQIATPFGRQRQDLASAAAAQHADLSSQYGMDMAALGGSEFNLWNDTAQDTAGSPYLFGTTGYDVPNQPGPYFSTPRPSGGGRTRPNRRRQNGGNRARR